MNRLFPRVVSEALAGITLGVVVLSAACDPKNGVQAGAPVLTTLTIVEPSGAKTNITGMTADCPAGVADGGDCDPGEVTVCRLASRTYCHCDAKADDDPSILPESPASMGTATCTYDPASTVIATFDRLLDTGPFTPGADAATEPTDIATVTVSSGTAPTVSANYIPNGVDGLIYPTYIGYPTGPSITFAADPGFPAGANVTLTLVPTKVRAKDQKTAFTGKGLLQAGVLTLSIAGPAVPEDAGTDAPANVDGGVDDVLPDALLPDAGVDL
jgi:hypothetical protein